MLTGTDPLITVAGHIGLRIQGQLNVVASIDVTRKTATLEGRSDVAVREAENRVPTTVRKGDGQRRIPLGVILVAGRRLVTRPVEVGFIVEPAHPDYYHSRHCSDGCDGS